MRITVSKDLRDKVKRVAEDSQMTVAEYVNGLIVDELGREFYDWEKDPQNLLDEDGDYED